MSRTSPVPFTLQEGLHCERGAAKIFGTDCAIVLQRFIWWTYPNKSKFGTLDENGNKWVYFTMDDLVDEFDWLSKSTLWRIINLLEENHILLSKQPEGKASRRKHYSISWPMWLKIQSGAYSKIGKDGKLIPSQIDGIPSGQIEEVGSLQIEGMGSIQIEAFPYNLELPRTHLDKEPSAPSRYLQPDKEDLETQARLDSQVASLKAAPSQGEAPHVPPPPPSKLEVLRLRVCKMVGRRPGTVWQEKEIAALKKVAALGTTEDEMIALEHRYSSKNQFRRRDAYTLLNNWNCEVDRALQEKPATAPSGASNKPPVFHPHQKLIDEIRGKLAAHPADMELVLNTGWQPTQEESREYSQLRDKLAELMMDNGGGK